MLIHGTRRECKKGSCSLVTAPDTVLYTVLMFSDWMNVTTMFNERCVSSVFDLLYSFVFVFVTEPAGCC